MPAPLVPNEAIPQLAAQVNSPTMLKMLQLLQKRGFIQNSAAVDEETATALERLTDLGLVDVGYEGNGAGRPFIWVSNHNGERVLKHFEASRRYKVVIHPRARTALAALTDEDQQAVRAAADALQSFDPASWPPEEVGRIAPDKPLYLMRVSPDLRAFIRILEPDGIELFDIVPEETLRLFLERYRAGSKVG